MKNRVGERWTMKSGHSLDIIKYNNAKDITVCFDNNFVLEGVSYSQIKRRTLGIPFDRVGERYLTNEGYWIEIIEYNGIYNCTVQIDGVILKNKRYDHILKGSISNPYHPTSEGVGFLGMGKYAPSTEGESVKMHKSWHNMFVRCYNLTYQKSKPTYKGCSVDKRWHNFQVFGNWYEQNYKDYMIGWELDKDILVKGNKVYSPDTCCFVPKEINILLTKRHNHRGKLPLGVSKNGKRFSASVSLNGEPVYLGTFDTVELAFQAYKLAKEAYIKEVAEKWKPYLTEPCYQALINYQVEIID